MNTRKLMASPIGTFLKVFLSTVLTMWIAMDNIFAVDVIALRAIISAGVVSAMPVVLNYLNPEYKNYGVGAAQG